MKFCETVQLSSIFFEKSSFVKEINLEKTKDSDFRKNENAAL